MDTLVDSNAPDSINMDDFVEVITSFKCKFCSFTALDGLTMSSHVKKIHLSVNNQSEAEMGTVVVVTNQIHQPDSQAVSMETNNAKKIPVFTESPPNTLVMEITKGMSPEFDPSTTVIDDVISSSSPLTLESAGCQQSDDVVQRNDVIQHSDVSNQTSMVHHNGTVVDVVAQAFESIGGDIPQPETVTMELFLCGQCSEGFGSIEACQAHMSTAHEENVNHPEPSSSGTTFKVDAETQVEKKTRKSVADQDRENVKIGKEEVDISSDEEEGKLYEYKRGAGKRKVKIPQHYEKYYHPQKELNTEETVIPSTTTPDKKAKKEAMERYTLRCLKRGCSARFINEETLASHAAQHVGKGYRCTECDFRSATWRMLQGHLWKFHKIDMDLFGCLQCPYKTEAYYKIVTHRMNCHGDGNDKPYVTEKPHTCEVCAKSFHSKTTRDSHRALHEKSKREARSARTQKSHVCKLCKSVFRCSKSLQLHTESVHEGIKPFKCKICPYATSQKAGLMCHVRTHTGERPFKCDVCEFSSSDHNTLRRHKMRHTGVKPYKCPHCPYTSIQANSLVSHCITKHPDLPPGFFECTICPFKTVKENAYKVHMNYHNCGLILKTASDYSRMKHQVSPPVITLDPNGKQIKVMTSNQNIASLLNAAKTGQTNHIATQFLCQALSAISKESDQTQNNDLQQHTSSQNVATTPQTVTLHIPISDKPNNIVTFQVQGPDLNKHISIKPEPRPETGVLEVSEVGSNESVYYWSNQDDQNVLEQDVSSTIDIAYSDDNSINNNGGLLEST